MYHSVFAGEDVSMSINTASHTVISETEIGSNLARAREEAGFEDVDSVSRVIGISIEYINDIEAGLIEAHLHEIYALICLYGCSTHIIFEGYFNIDSNEIANASDIHQCRDHVLNVIGFHKKLNGKSLKLVSPPLARGVEKSRLTSFSSISVKDQKSNNRLPSTSLSRRANSIIAKHSLHKLPVNVYQIAQNLGITVSFEEFPSEFYMKLKGFCYKDDDTSLIGINRSHPTVLQRFTIAHELHHYLYDFDANRYLCGPENQDKALEWNAENFAAELLMPQKYVQNLVHTPLNIRYLTITLVAKHFGVSYEAAAIRLAKSGLISNSKNACSKPYRNKDKEKTKYLLENQLAYLPSIFGLETGIEELQMRDESVKRHFCGAHIHDQSHTVCWKCGLDLDTSTTNHLKNRFRQSQANISPGSVLSFQKKKNDCNQLSLNLDAL
jgi:Zn-dependent peptidase ImmA (M78 family)/transcriptional regulator with XRE-family HTH domain